MNAENHTSIRLWDLLWPGIFFLIAFNLLLISQLQSMWNAGSNLSRQEILLDEQMGRARQEAVQARTMQVTAESMANDLLSISKSDPEIRRIVEKYQIRRTTSGTSPAPANNSFKGRAESN